MTAAMETVLTVLVAGGVLGIGYRLFASWQARRRVLRRLYMHDDAADEPVAANEAERQGWLSRWLVLAGFFSPRASSIFLSSCGVAILGGLLAGLLYRVAALDPLLAMVANVPGGAGDVLVAVLGGGASILFVIAAMAPLLVVRAARRRRVRDTERDLPLVLELFATMAEAGLGFDAALGRIVRSQPPGRPLLLELATFQRDVLGGMPRIHALRRLAQRLDVISVSSFTSAVIQAEQIGASMADTLRHQAEALRERRREQALLQAQAMPVKLVFPLVACFLPGIFLSTLAPVLYQMIQVSNSFMRSTGR